MMRRRYLPAALAVLAGLAVSIGLFAAVRGQARERLALDLARRTGDAAASISHEIGESLELLESVAAVVEALPDVQRSGFESLARRARSHDRSLRAVQWAPRVAAGAGGSARFPVLWAEPQTESASPIGSDLLADPACQERLAKAADSGEPAVTGRIRLGAEAGEPWAVLVLVPVYRGSPPVTVEERRQALKGYVVGVVGIGALLDRARKEFGLSDLVLRLEDASAQSGETAHLGGAEMLADRAGPQARRPMTVGGRRWVTQAVPTGAFLAARRESHEWMLLLGGLAATLLLGAYLWREARRAGALSEVNASLEREVVDRQRAEALAGRQKREAEAVAELARSINASLDLHTVLQRVAETARELCRGDGARLALRDPQTGSVSYRYSAGSEYRSFSTMVVTPGKGISGHVLATGQPFRTDCYTEDPRITTDMLEAVKAEGIVAVLAVPILGEGRVDGVLTVDTRGPRSFTDGDEALLSRIADQAAVALRNARLYAEARSRLQHTETLLAVSHTLGGTLDLPEVARRTVREAVRILDADTGGAWLLDPTGRDFLPLAGYRVPPELLEVIVRAPISADHRTVRAMSEGAGPMQFTVGTAELPPDDFPWRLGPGQTLLLHPIRIKAQMVGALAVLWTRRTHTLTEDERRVLDGMVRQAAIAIENARLYQEAERAYQALSRTQHQLSQSQKMEAVGKLAGGVAHDFNNLLTVISGRSEMALARLGAGAGERLRRDLELIGQTAGRAAELTRQLLAFSRRQVMQLQVTDLNAVVGGMASMLSRLIGEDIQFVTVPGSGLGRVKADPGQIQQVIMNLAVNARDAMPGGGRLTIQTANRDLDPATAERLDAKPGPVVMLAVTDTGCGMDEATRERVFEPFFTTKEVGKGTGLGLSTAFGIVSQHGGCLEVESAPGQGTTFRIYLPRVEEVVAPAAAPQADEIPRGTETILLVEDDAGVGELAREMLAGLGYTVLLASRPAEALAAAEGHVEPLHLLLTDVVMPGMSGRELAERLCRRRPDLRVLFMSGYTDTILAPHGVLEAGTVLIHKPFLTASLARQVRAVLDAPAELNR